MLGMEFSDDHMGYAVAKELFSRNILISGTYINARVLRIEPPLVISQAQLEQFLSALEQSLQAVQRQS